MIDLDALERLQRLRDSGALTDEEFAEQKRKLLVSIDTTSSADDGTVEGPHTVGPQWRQAKAWQRAIVPLAISIFALWLFFTVEREGASDAENFTSAAPTASAPTIGEKPAEATVADQAVPAKAAAGKKIVDHACNGLWAGQWSDEAGDHEVTLTLFPASETQGSAVGIAVFRETEGNKEVGSWRASWTPFPGGGPASIQAPDKRDWKIYCPGDASGSLEVGEVDTDGYVSVDMRRTNRVVPHGKGFDIY